MKSNQIEKIYTSNKIKLITLISISFLCITIAIIHVVFPTIAIDTIALILFFAAIVPWLFPLIKTIETPGGFVLHMTDLKKAEKEIKESGVINENIMNKRFTITYPYDFIKAENPNLALELLGLEVESKLYEIIKSKGYNFSTLEKDKIYEALKTENVFSEEQLNSIRKLTSYLEQSKNDIAIEKSAITWAFDFGPVLLTSLDEKIGEKNIEDLVQKWRNRDGAAFIWIATDMAKCMIKSPDSFFNYMSKNNKEFNEWVDTLFNVFTIYEAGDELEDELYSAYYERLKEIMMETARSKESSEYALYAKTLHDALKKTKIRRIL